MSTRAEISRRAFLSAGLGAAAVASAYVLGKPSEGVNHISGSIVGAPSGLGHLLREGGIPPPQGERRVSTLIVGGGIAGLSAAWALQRHGYENFTLLELDSAVGGNSQSGSNAISAYPWGAHYVPVPGKDARLVRTLFEELQIIDGYENGEPHFREEYLCAAPEERLHIFGSWQEGLIPSVGVSADDQEQYLKFHSLMENLKDAIGSDHKRAFTIPLDLSSQDAQFLQLDSISMQEFLRQHAFTSAPLLWYVNYCCLDDYGAGVEHVSAWAGIHYFASRQAWAANAEDHDLLTWPQGNGWIVEKLQAKLNRFLERSALVFKIEEHQGRLNVDYYLPHKQSSQRIVCEDVIYCAPRFTAPYVISDMRHSSPMYISRFEYDPWMVANVTLSSLPEDSHLGLAWDNVFYKSPSLGYVNATHQNIGRMGSDTVITYYLPLAQKSPQEARREALAKTWPEWRDLIVADLRSAHRDIVSKIQNIDVWLWGHAMIRPATGFIWGDERKQALEPFGRVHFAHSDMSGISIFEEAQYRGVLAAESLLRRQQIQFTSLM